MGTIINSRKNGKKVIIEISSDYEEYLHLRGHLEDIYLFSENVAQVQTNISQRGKNAATKYFLIPRQFRNGFKFNNATSCQKIDLKNRVIFIFVVNKLKINPSRREARLEKYRREEIEKKENLF